MIRYYFLSKDINETANFEHNLIEKGVEKSHIHVYGVSDSDAQKHHLPPVFSIFKSDIVHYLLRGTLIGLLLSALIVSILHFLKVESLQPIAIAASLFITGFITWEAGLIGLHKTNYKLLPLKKHINSEQHIVFVDTEEKDEIALLDTSHAFSNIRQVAVGDSVINPFD